MAGFIFYQGPSRIDGAPIVAIATYGSANPKTGDMVQTWILREDMSPLEAIWTGADRSICGNCPLRGIIKKDEHEIERNKDRGCYVPVRNAPRAIWEAYQRGRYASIGDADLAPIARLGLRYGSYGDPVAVPMRAWARLRRACGGDVSTGYTHQWRDRRFARWSRLIMASTHSPAESAEARSRGWRTFRSMLPGAAIERGEIMCPASAEAGYRATCATCGACDGSRGDDDRRVSIAIVIHGSPAVLSSAKKVLASV